MQRTQQQKPTQQKRNELKQHDTTQHNKRYGSGERSCQLCFDKETSDMGEKWIT